MCTVNMIIVVTMYKFKMTADTNNSSHLSLDWLKKQHPYIIEVMSKYGACQRTESMSTYNFGLVLLWYININSSGRSFQTI